MFLWIVLDSNFNVCVRNRLLISSYGLKDKEIFLLVTPPPPMLPHPNLDKFPTQHLPLIPMSLHWNSIQPEVEMTSNGKLCFYRAVPSFLDFTFPVLLLSCIAVAPPLPALCHHNPHLDSYGWPIAVTNAAKYFPIWNGAFEGKLS